MTSLDFLKRDHAAILRVLDRLEQLVTGWQITGQMDTEEARKLCLFLTLFGDRHHLQGEVRILHPLLLERGILPTFGAVAVVRCLQDESCWYVRSLALAEKAMMRGKAGAEARFAENASGCIDYLREAIRREESTLIPQAEAAMSAADAEAVSSAWARHEQRGLDPVLREACDRILESLDAPVAPNPGRGHAPPRRRAGSKTPIIPL